jgi:hypothetical protein
LNPDPDNVAAETAAGLIEMANLTSDAGLAERLNRAAEVLRADHPD